jgi:hypothetical protein
MRSLALGLTVAFAVGLTWLSLRMRNESEGVPSVEARVIRPDSGPGLGSGARLVTAGHRVEADPLRIQAKGEAENTQEPSPALEDPPRPLDPHKETRLIQFGLVLNDYYEVGEIQKSSKLCTLVSLSVAVLLEQNGRFEEMSSIPTSLDLQEGIRTMSINGRLYRFTDIEFPEFQQTYDQHMALSKEDYTSGKYTVPPELEVQAMNLAAKAQSSLFQ